MENSVSPDRFYVYMFRRLATPDTPSEIVFPDGTVPFYVGKGCLVRIDDHEKCARKRETCKHLTCRVIRKVWREGGQIYKDKVDERLQEQEAFTLEQDLIAYGRQIGWPLVNQTDGGEGVSGYIRDAEWCKRRSELTKRLVEEGKFDHLRTVNKGRVHTEEEREKRRQSVKETWSDPELLELKSRQSRQMWEVPGYREKHNQAMSNPDVRAKLAYWKGRESPVAKDYEGFVSPEGVVHAPIHNLAAFCHQHGLQKSGMCLVAQGKQSQHLGWTRYPPIEKHPYKGTGFISPTGEVYADIPHLSNFCKEHDLNQRCMSQVSTGKRRSHKGWTRYNP